MDKLAYKYQEYRSGAELEDSPSNQAAQGILERMKSAARSVGVMGPETPSVMAPSGDLGPMPTKAAQEQEQNIKTLAAGQGPLKSAPADTPELRTSTPQETQKAKAAPTAQESYDPSQAGLVESSLQAGKSQGAQALANTYTGAADFYGTLDSLAGIVSRKAGMGKPEMFSQLKGASEYWAEHYQGKVSIDDYMTRVVGGVLGSGPALVEFAMGPEWAALKGFAQDGQLGDALYSAARRAGAGAVFKSAHRLDAAGRIAAGTAYMTGESAADQLGQTGSVDLGKTAEAAGVGLGMMASGGFGAGNKTGLRQRVNPETWFETSPQGREIYKALDEGRIDPLTKDLAKQFYTTDLVRGGTALNDTSLAVVDKVNLLRQGVDDWILADQGITPDPAKDYAITGKTTTTRAADAETYQTAIELYQGAKADTLVEEWMHREYDRLPASERRAVTRAYEAHKAGLAEGAPVMSEAEFYAKGATDKLFADQVAAQKAANRPAWLKAVDAGKARWDSLVQTVRGVPGAKVAEGDTLTPAGAEGYQTKTDYQVAPFFSPTARHIEGVNVKKPQPAKFWLDQMFDKKGNAKPGLRPEELDDLGLREWLAGAEGQISKEQVLQFIQDGGPKLEEVRKGSSGPQVTQDMLDAAERAGNWDEFDRLTRVYEDQQLGSNANDTGNETKFANYQLPGGENYREVLLTVPRTEVTPADVAMRMFGRDWASLSEEERGFVTNELRNVYGGANVSMQDYRSSHWSEPNVIAHMRLNDRVDAEGKRTLFVEEIQSDWHQKGRKEGYGTRTGKVVEDAPYWKIEWDDGTASNGYGSRAQARGALSEQVHRVPNAPFKKSWPMLAFKRILREAVEKGYDSVAWTTGEQQAERYDLSKSISKVEYEKNGNLRAWDLDGKQVMRQKVEEQDLPDAIGKEAAERLLSAEPQSFGERTLSGLDLKVGGEGMKGFYDKMLPKAVQDYVKKLDPAAKVGEANLDAGEYKVNKDSRALPYRLERTTSPDILSRHATAEEAWAESERLGATAVHSLPITPAMREAILANGQPSYQVRPVDEIIYDPTPVAPLDRKYAEGGNTNLQRINSTEDVLKLINDVSRHNAETGAFEAQARGVRSWEETGKAADGAVSIDQLLLRKEGQTGNAEQLYAARQLQAEFAGQLAGLVEKATATGDPADKDAAAKAWGVFAAVTAARDGMVAEAGRALNIMSRPVGDTKTQLVSAAFADLARKHGGERNADAIMDTLYDMARLNADGKLDIEELSRMSRRLEKASTFDMILEARYMAMLANPATHLRNTIGNSIALGAQIPERFLAETIGRARGLFGGADLDRIEAGETAAMMYGGIEGLRAGAQAFLRTVRTGESTDPMGKLETSQRAISAENMGIDSNSAWGKGIDFIAERLRTGNMLMGAEDDFFKAIGYSMELNARAHRTSTRERLTGQEFAERIQELVTNPPWSMQMDAMDFAHYTTFTNALGEGMTHVQAALVTDKTVTLPSGKTIEVPTGKAFRLAVPFFRTPANIVAFGVKRSPLAVFAPSVWQDFANGGAARDMAVARITLGSTLGYMAAQAASAGLITGGGPSDQKEKENLRATGWQPYSVKVGNKWMSYQPLEPYSAIIGAAADLALFDTYLEENERNNAAMMIASAFSQAVTSKTFMQGLDGMLNVLSDPDRYGDRYAQQFAASWVPSPVKAVRRDVDPLVREVWTVGDALKNALPWSSGDLYPRRDRYGEVVTLGDVWLSNTVDPVRKSEIKNEGNSPTYAIDKAILDNHVPVQKPGKVLHWEGAKAELTPEEFDRYQTLPRDLGLVDALDRIVQSQAFKAATGGPDGVKSHMIREVFGDFREQARYELVKESQGVPGGIAERLELDRMNRQMKGEALQ